MNTTTVTTEERALAHLRALAGPGAEFREGQLEAIRDLVDDRARVLCVQRTGWGKSAVYFVSTAILRERGAGPALIVSPLLALMRNQLAAARALGIRAHTINSTNVGEWREVQELLAADAVDLLLISPERLNNPRFREQTLPVFADSIGLPLSLSGGDSAQTEETRAWAERLATALDIPVELYDERFTTRIAQQRGGEAAEDSLAAAVLLEDWLARSA